jgi:hypothetical protein
MAQDVIKTWSPAPRALAEAMMEEYGEPNLVDDDALLWLHNGPWRKTTVYRTALYHATAGSDKDYLQQTIGYEVPADKVAALKLFDKKLELDTAAGELSSCSDSESSNYLALNLADEIVLGERSVADARSFYDRTLRLAAAGKSSLYMESLLRPPF